LLLWSIPDGPARQLEGRSAPFPLDLPVTLFPATSDPEKVSFNQINRNTGHRIKYQKVDAETGEEVDADDIMKATRSIPTPMSRSPRTNSTTYFDDIQDVKITKDVLDLAKHIVEQKSGSFEPSKFENHYEAALVELINRKRSGVPMAASKPSRTSGNVVDLMDALRQSLKGGKAAAPAEKVKAKRAPKRTAGQREMLLPIAGGGHEKTTKKADKPARASSRSQKAG
jgi:non-homologous end joining protein Ku